MTNIVIFVGIFIGPVLSYGYIVTNVCVIVGHVDLFASNISTCLMLDETLSVNSPRVLWSYIKYNFPINTRILLNYCDGR